MAYQVKLQVFEGPFDLLLHLIAKRELDVYEVSLAEITEEYLAYIRSMQDLDLEIATEFLLVAATLVEIKASRLLPGPPAAGTLAAVTETHAQMDDLGRGSPGGIQWIAGRRRKPWRQKVSASRTEQPIRPNDFREKTWRKRGRRGVA